MKKLKLECVKYYNLVNSNSNGLISAQQPDSRDLKNHPHVKKCVKMSIALRAILSKFEIQQE